MKSGQKVLVAAPSNVAVDNLAERLASFNVNLIRIGHPGKVSDRILPNSLQVKAEQPISTLNETISKIEELEKSSSSYDNRTLINTLKKKANKQKKKLDKTKLSLLREADVVLGTLIGCGSPSPLDLLPKSYFNLTVIDECSQSQEMDCWTVIPHSPKLLLAGDHHQLPPTVLSSKSELLYSLMERILDRHWYTVAKMLSIQYRMNAKIMTWSSKTFYMGGLYAATLVQNHKLSDLDHVTKCELTDSVLLMIDTAGSGMKEFKGGSKFAPSFGNVGEAAIVADHVKRLVNSGVRDEEIAIITPYTSQVCINLTRMFLFIIDTFLYHRSIF